jgi:hypothetical protein
VENAAEEKESTVAMVTPVLETGRWFMEAP